MAFSKYDIIDVKNTLDLIKICAEYYKGYTLKVSQYNDLIPISKRELGLREVGDQQRKFLNTPVEDFLAKLEMKRKIRIETWRVQIQEDKDRLSAMKKIRLEVGGFKVETKSQERFLDFVNIYLDKAITMLGERIKVTGKNLQVKEKEVYSKEDYDEELVFWEKRVEEKKQELKKFAKKDHEILEFIEEINKWLV